MDAFRNFVKSWFGKAFLLMISVPFIVMGIEGYFASSSSTNVSQVVNGDVISKEELDTQIKALRDGYLNSQSVNGDASLLNQEFIEKAALNNLILRRLLIQQTEKLGIVLTEAQIEQSLTQITGFQENGVFSPAKYEAYLKSRNMTSQEFVQGIRRDRAIDVLLANLSMALVNEKDLQQILNLATEQRHLHVASIPFAEYLANVQVSDAEIQQYYEQHKNQLVQLAKVDVDYIVVSPEQMKLDVTVSEDDIKQAYQQYVQNLPKTVKHILITTDTRNDAEAKQRADEAYAKLTAGSSFAQVASEYSEDVDSKEKGGTITGYAEGVFSESFDKAVKDVQAGQMSKPVKTNFGYHIIAVEQTATAPTLDSIKAELTAQVQKQKTDVAYADAINRTNEAVIGSDSLDVVKQDVKDATVESIKGISPTNKHPILGEVAVKSRLFGAEVKQGDRHAQSSIQLANGQSVWVKVTNYIPAGVPTLDAVKEQVKTLVAEEKAMQQAKAKIQATLDAFKSQPAETVLATGNIKFEDAGFSVRGQQIPAVQHLAFSLPAPQQGFWSVGTTKLDKELLIVAVSDVKAPTEQNQQQKTTYQQLYTSSRAQQELADYMEYLKANAKIESKN